MGLQILPDYLYTKLNINFNAWFNFREFVGVGILELMERNNCK